MLSIFSTLHDLGAGVISVLLAVATIASLLVLYTFRYQLGAHTLYDFLDQHYPEKLKQIAKTKTDFPLINWSSPRTIMLPSGMPLSLTRYDIRDQFRMIKALKEINKNDKELQQKLTEIRGNLVYGLWAIFLPFSLLVLCLIIYFLLFW